MLRVARVKSFVATIILCHEQHNYETEQITFCVTLRQTLWQSLYVDISSLLP